MSRKHTSVLCLLLCLGAQTGQATVCEARFTTSPQIGRNWQTVFFKEIYKRSSIAGIGGLKQTKFTHDDVGLRVWIGFGPTSLKGFVVIRKKGQWSGVYLRPITKTLARENYQQILAAPKSGWEKMWQKLVDKDILKLSGMPESDWTDGESIVVEVKKGARYRTYMYDNPQLQTSEEAQRILAIVQYLRDQFAIPG